MLPSLRVAHIYQSSAGLLVCILLIPQVARRTHPSPFPAEPQTDPSTQSNRTRRTCIRLRGQSERERSKIQLGRNRHMWDDTEELRLGEEIKNMQSIPAFSVMLSKSGSCFNVRETNRVSLSGSFSHSASQKRLWNAST